LDLDIIGIIERWLSDKVNDGEVMIEGMISGIKYAVSQKRELCNCAHNFGKN